MLCKCLCCGRKDLCGGRSWWANTASIVWSLLSQNQSMDAQKEHDGTQIWRRCLWVWWQNLCLWCVQISLFSYFRTYFRQKLEILLHFKIKGGFDGFSCLRSAEVYDIAEDKWSILPEMQSVRSGLKCVVYKDQIYVIGGYDGRLRLNSCEIFEPKRNRWLPSQSMKNPRSNFGIEVIDDEICVSGGFDGITTINKVEFFNPKDNKWYIERIIDTKIPKYSLVPTFSGDRQAEWLAIVQHMYSSKCRLLEWLRICFTDNSKEFVMWIANQKWNKTEKIMKFGKKSGKPHENNSDSF